MATAMVPINDEILAEPAPKGRTRDGMARLDAIDMLRGLVIAIMVLDHTRDYFHNSFAQFSPTDPAHTWPLLFLTRWVTHLCAPTFVFLAGVSISFQKANGKTGNNLSSFLVKRGLWLIFLECTVVTFGFNFGEPFILLQVIWAIGMGMIGMAALSRLSERTVLGIALAILLLYPLVASATAGATGIFGVIRTLALSHADFPEAYVAAPYAVIPWFGVMCLGYGMGPVYRLPKAERFRRLFAIAIGLLLAFVLLRLLNGYGDPKPWTYQTSPMRTLLSFLNISKYPPSPDYVCIMLGIATLLFLMLEALRGPLATILLAYGRTPLFTYLCHVYVVHLAMVAVAIGTGMPLSVTTHASDFTPHPAVPFGFGLGGVYVMWLLILAILFPISLWFAGVKRRRRDWWLSYL